MNLLEEWKADHSFDRAYVTALRYIDFSRVAETLVETVVCYLNAALWLHRALSLARKEPQQEQSTQYALKECILSICRDTCSIAAEHFHPGMQAFVFWRAACLINCSVSTGRLGDETDLRQFEVAVRNWLYAMRLCPVGVPSNILVCEASVLYCLLGKVHVAYVDALASMEGSQSQSSVPLVVVEHARFETFARGLHCLRSERDDCSQESLRLSALEAMLAHHGLTRRSAQELQHAVYACWTADGWRAPVLNREGEIPNPSVRIQALLEKLRTRWLTTDPVPQLHRRWQRLGPGRDRQVSRLLLKLKKRRQRALQNGQGHEQDETSQGQAEDELQKAFEEQRFSKEREPLLEVEEELRGLLEQQSRLHPPTTPLPVGKRLHGVRFHSSGRVEFMIEERCLGVWRKGFYIRDFVLSPRRQDAPGGLPADLFSTVFKELGCVDDVDNFCVNYATYIATFFTVESMALTVADRCEFGTPPEMYI